MQIPRRKSEEFKRLKDDNGPIHLTEEGLKQLEQKLERIKKSLPELIAETQRAAAYGDRSENAEYKLAKSALRRANFQILEIQEQLKRVIVINTGSNASETIQLGSTVVLESDGTQKTFQIVGSQETNPTNGRISYLSPIGAALMKHKRGDTIIIKTPTGLKKYTVLEIR